MTVLKCKMCGGTLDYQEGMTVCECEYCGSKQTIPTVDNEKKIRLFERANRLRYNCEFDKAGSVYESIIEEFPEEAEGYWGNLLCKFGIEYVDDPADGRKVPTCHRASFESVMDDEDFELVMENADVVARGVYREQAKQIEELRKGIVEVSAKEQPYDIFICYKETDENGDRTLDSVLAQDIYDRLTEKGYRVFFSRISLEDKLGTEYEPYIFAALNSARVMLAFGTSYDYYNAVWVKNEWSRFLRLVAKDKGKYLIPCYKDIDAYDIPKEFAKLQAQDMGKVGALQDLLRGVDKIFGKGEEQKSQGQPRVIQQVVTGGANVETLLKRGYDALEDGAFNEAKGFFNDALNSDPESSEAYLGLFMAHIESRDKTSAKSKFVNGNNTENRYWKRAKQYARDSIADELLSWENERNARMQRDAEEEAQREDEEAKRRAELDVINSHLVAIKAGTYVPVLEDETELENLKAEAEAARKAGEIAEAELAAIPEQGEAKRLVAEIDSKRDQLMRLGFFKGKEKKNIQEQISALEQSLTQTRAVIEIKEMEVSQLKKKYHEAQSRVDSYIEQALKNKYETLLKRKKHIIFGNLKTGDKVRFGQYKQGEGGDVQPIVWCVLEDGKKALLITELCIGYGQFYYNLFGDEKLNSKWENSNLRSWLNHDFIKEAFSEEEKSIICATNIKADKNTKYSTDPGNDTCDKVFLLSIAEAEKYLPSDEQRKCQPTDSLKKYIIENNDIRNKDTGNCCWWLRSPGYTNNYTAYVDSDGAVNYHGQYVLDNVSCVRPAIWINLES